MAAAGPYGVYDDFAWCYSRGWGEDFHGQARPAFVDHVFPRLAHGARVLDLCCGSGDLSVLLAQHGFQVTGIDGSEQMLHFARQRVPEAEFHLADARSFEYESAFEAVLSTFDSLNHVLRLEELERVFGNVWRALRPGGLFVFDMNMQEAFETLWIGHNATVEDDSVSITRGSYDVAEKIGRAEVTLFRREPAGQWRRTDLAVLEKCYTSEEISCALEHAGMIEINERSSYELGMRGDIALGRSFFFATKP